MELGMFINLSRLDKYEERGTIPSPKTNGRFKEYSAIDVARLRKVVVLSELGVPLVEIRRLILGINVPEVVASIKSRIAEVKRLIIIAETFFVEAVPEVVQVPKPVEPQPKPSSGIVYK